MVLLLNREANEKHIYHKQYTCGLRIKIVRSSQKDQAKNPGTKFLVYQKNTRHPLPRIIKGLALFVMLCLIIR